MSTKGKSWKWKSDANGRKALSVSMKERRAAGWHPKTHGLSSHPSYNSHKKMMQRCYHEHHPDYVNYGGRGIEVAERWHDVRNFVEDMGEMPKKCSLERIDVNGNYEPDNCTWIPMRLQSKNRRPWKHSKDGLEAIRKARSKE